MNEKISLILENKASFEGYSFGALKNVSGEVVFNTGMMGYPETLTDPSYKGQILVLTYPLIGNYGIPNNEKNNFGIEKNFESSKIHVSGLIIQDYSFDYSHWSAVKSLSEWLIEQGIPAIYGIDTRALTKKLRERGVMLGKIVYDKNIEFEDPNKKNLVNEVSIKKPVVYEKEKGSKKVVLVDCGAKNNIINSLLKRNITVIRVPWNYNFNELDYDGLFLSNGPGNPKHCNELIKNVKTAMKKEKPIFGICLGNQILALSSGADTYKLKYGHRSQNQPCVLNGTKRCFITSQNHGYAVDSKTLKKGWREFFVNANDGTNEGIIHESKPFFSVQFHPEATPGPVDTEFLFDKFVKSMRK
jgi:carbamoyl-phosphate synthase small subunit